MERPGGRPLGTGGDQRPATRQLELATEAARRFHRPSRLPPATCRRRHRCCGDAARGRGSIDGTATLRWRDAVSGRLNRPLGSYRADLEGTDRGVAIELSTEGGALELQGSGLWRTQDGLNFSGLARPAPAGRAELERLLSLIGPAQADGSRAIRIGR